MGLQNLEAHIKYAKAKFGEVLPQEQVDEFYRRFDQLLMGEHELWKKIRSTQSTAPTVPRRTNLTPGGCPILISPHFCEIGWGF
jgi:hypothetical protein